MMFYTKKNQNEAELITDEQVSQMLPKSFHEVTIRVYLKDPNREDLAQRYTCSFLILSHVVLVV